MRLRGGIDLGGTKIQTAIIDAAGEVKGEARHPTPTKGEPKDVAEELGISVDSVYQAKARVTAAVQTVARDLAEDEDRRDVG